MNIDIRKGFAEKLPFDANTFDIVFLSSVIEQNNLGRKELTEILTAHGMKPIPSHTNFITAEVGSGAEEMLNKLLGAGVFIRRPGQPPLDRCIRVTIGRTEDHEVLAEALRTTSETD